MQKLKSLHLKAIWLVIPISLLALICAFFYLWIWRNLPDVNNLLNLLNPPSVRITDRTGRILYDFISTNGGRHTVIPLDQIPLQLRQATIATEDNSFYINQGIDLAGILRSVWIDLVGADTVAGGSTITQQVARNILLGIDERNQRTLERKLREVVLAWELTRHFSKDQILALYLNQTYYGAMSYGVDAAAQTYFGKSINELDLAECAMIAGLSQAPSAYNPLIHPEVAKSRQKIVLDLMVKQKIITTDQARLAFNEPLIYTQTPFPIEAPHFVFWLRNQIDQMFSQDEIYAHGGLIVRTSLNLDWQHLAEQAISNQMEKLRQNQDNPLGYNMHNAALVAIDPNNGEILAMVGSPDYFDKNHSGAINMAITPRQPGSALKPLIYATAFDPNRSQPFTPATLLMDVTTHYVTHDGQPYTPVNYDGLEHGPVLVRTALASSLNIPAVQTLNAIGLPALFKTGRSLGITSFGDPNQYDLSLALGGGEVSLLELSGAYGALANGGFRVIPTAILEVTDPQGNILYQHPAKQPVQVLDPRVAWLISDILSDDDARIVGFGRNSILRLDRTAAVKTGTTTDFHDNWTIGYTPDLVVGVWAGNADHEAMRNINGLTGAAPVWAQFIRSVLAGQPKKPFVQPPGLTKVEICALSGLLPTPACPYNRFEWFIDGTQPEQKDNLYRQVTIDQATGTLADPSTPADRQVTRLALMLPPSAQAWAHTNHVLLYSDLIGSSSIVQGFQGDKVNGPGNGGGKTMSLNLVSPAPETTYQIASGFDKNAQRLLIAVTGDPSLGPVTIYLDGSALATINAPPYESWWQLTPGSHLAWATSTIIDGDQVTSNKVHFIVK